MACSEGRGERQLACEDACADDPGELAGVGAGFGRVWTSDAKEIKHRCLWLKDRAAADCADFYRGHRYCYLQVATKVLHGCYAVGGLDDLCGILASATRAGQSCHSESTAIAIRLTPGI